MNIQLTKYFFKRVWKSGLPFGLLATVSILLLVSACGTAPSQPEEEVTDYVWPAPPSQPVIRYLREFRSELDVEAEKKSNWSDALLGKEQELIWSLQSPYGVNVDGQGKVMVADTKLPGLAVFVFAEQKFSMVGSDAPGKLSQPVGAATDRFGRIYVADGKGQKVAVYDQNGIYLNDLGGGGEFERPVAVAVDSVRERVYVSDLKKHHVAVFNFDGEQVSVIGERGVEPGQFNFPLDLALDAEGRLYVVDSMNFRIQVFEPDDGAVTTISEQGTAAGQLARPKGVAVDSDGNIYVSDAAFNNVQVFNRGGDLLMVLGAVGIGPGGFSFPAGLAVDAQDRLYVADQGNRRIQVFQYLGKPSYEGQKDSGSDQ
jgi:DNA-binding beta-propeller fold protein YncE